MNKVSKSNKKNFNKALATTAVLSMILAPNTVWGASSSDSSSFKDINQAAPWAKESVVKAKNLGFIGGDNNGNFHPLDMITRQEIASIISKFLKLPTPKVEKSSFKDVSASAWSKDAIEAVLKAGVMVGDNGNFHPEAPITREELAAVLVSTVKLDTTGKGNNIKTADKALVSEWARPAVQTAIEFGLLKGDGTNFLPKKKAQRQEVAAVAVNLVNVVLHPVSGGAGTENVTGGSATVGGVQDKVADAVKDTNVNNGTVTPAPTVPAGGGTGGSTGGGAVSDTTAPVIEEASGIISGQEVRASRSGNTFTISLSGFSDDKMFTGLKFKVSENSTISFSVLILGPKSKELTQGDNIVSVKDLLGDLDSGEPGVSVGKAKGFLGELSGTLTDKAGNKTPVNIILKD